MNRDEIKQLLPHREPMLLIDSTEWVGDEVVSKYTIRPDEFFIQGHFPGNPIVPGVILCEMMAQGSALLMEEQLKDHLALYAGLDDVHFKHVVRAGDVVVTRAKVIKSHGPLIIVEATATVHDELCCKGKLSFILTKKQ